MPLTHEHSHKGDGAIELCPSKTPALNRKRPEELMTNLASQ